MKVDVRFTIPELDAGELNGATAVVVDVVRATTTLTTALARGAGAVFPAASAEEAIRLLQSLGREDTLLCGERKGLRPEGYDLGNSPSEFTDEVVAGKRLIMNTTNGTRALRAVEDASRVVAAAFVNLGAVAEAIASEERVLVVCAGRNDRFALEDAACAGALLLRLRDSGVELDAGDAARSAMTLAAEQPLDRAFLASTHAGRALAAVDLEEDLGPCAEMDVLPVVPVFRDRMVTLQETPGG
ncbi:MAG: 2-phosphosulfolactate phosphatase [Gemmatimonadota bacterium]|jgi:2-phosphosulfolactate phosphatase